MKSLTLVLTFLAVLILNEVDGQEERSDVTVKMHEALDFAEAEDFEKAREIYQYLYLQQTEGWKKGILLYDIATTYLQEGKWEEAIQHFEKIPLSESSFPPLVWRVKSNEAVARWRLSRHLFEQLQKEPLYYREEYVKILFLLKEAIENIDAADRAHCQVLDLEGDEHCVPAYDLDELRTEIEQGRALLLLNYTKKRAELMSLQEGLPLLLSGVNGIIVSLENLSTLLMDMSIKKEQLHRILVQSSSWEPLFTSLKIKIEKESNKNKKKHYFDAERSFMKTIAALKDEKIETSIEDLKAAEVSLNALLFMIMEEDPIRDSIQRILTSYERALESTPLQAGELHAIADQQETMKGLFSRKKIDPNLLNNALNELSSSFDYVQVGKEIEARLAFLNSYQAMRRLGWQFDEEKGSAKNILEYSISEQFYSLLINQLISGTKEADDVKIHKKLTLAQENVFLEAQLFWNAALKEQEMGFSGIKGKAGRCQHSPWSAVLPLFKKGYSEAELALNALEGDESLSIPFRHQQNALHFWKMALNALNNPDISQDSCERPPEQSNEKKPEPEKQQQENQPKQRSIDQVLRLLQQMEHDDRQKKRREMKIDTGEKPW